MEFMKVRALPVTPIYLSNIAANVPLFESGKLRAARRGGPLSVAGLSRRIGTGAIIPVVRVGLARIWATQLKVSYRSLKARNTARYRGGSPTVLRQFLCESMNRGLEFN